MKIVGLPKLAVAFLSKTFLNHSHATTTNTTTQYNTQSRTWYAWYECSWQEEAGRPHTPHYFAHSLQ
jgi:hypothetical protein